MFEYIFYQLAGIKSHKS